MEWIELRINNRKVLYLGDERTITLKDGYGVEITCKIPNDWPLNRIFQYMEELLVFIDE
jgi:hypothetical protein